ncbi:hypothetical protein ABBQ38_008118 [Trebouxia sp. C0009 RCD-2024]
MLTFSAWTGLWQVALPLPIRGVMPPQHLSPANPPILQAGHEGLWPVPLPVLKKEACVSYFGGGGHARGTYKPGAAAAGLSVNVHRSSLYLVSSVAGGFATCFFKADSVVDWMGAPLPLSCESAQHCGSAPRSRLAGIGQPMHY